MAHESEYTVSIEPEENRTEAGTDECRCFVVMGDCFINHCFDFLLVGVCHDVFAGMPPDGFEPPTHSV